MEKYELDILNNLVTEFNDIEEEEFGENVLRLFNGKPKISIEHNWAVIFIYSETVNGTNWDKALHIGFGEVGGNGARANWEGTIYWELRNGEEDYITSGETPNGSPWAILHNIFASLDIYLEASK